MMTKEPIQLVQGIHPPQKPPTPELVSIWKLLAKSNKKISLKPKSFLFQSGDPIQNVYIVISGYLLLIKNDIVLDILEPGQSAGAALLGQDQPQPTYPITVQAMSSCDVLHVPANFLYDLIKSDPSVNAYFIRQFRARMDYMQSVRAILNLPVANRIAFFLVHKKRLLEHTLITRKTMALALNTTTETVIRVLKDFENNKIIGYENGKIVLLDQEYLQKLCQQI